MIITLRQLSFQLGGFGSTSDVHFWVSADSAADTDDGVVLRSAGDRTDGCGTEHNHRLIAAKLSYIRSGEAVHARSADVLITAGGPNNSGSRDYMRMAES